MNSILQFAHTLAESTLESGDVAIDATVGNGHDTLMLADAVGDEGHVYGFDVQEEAINQTRARLEENGSWAQTELVRMGHESMDRFVPAHLRGEVGCVMFNLGYLPGSNSRVTTGPETTIPALKSAVRMIRAGGCVTVVVYSGHEGGTEEAAAVDEWARALPQGQYEVLSYRFVNQRNDPPRLIAVHKRENW